MAATYTWSNSGTDWGTASNWGGTIPASSDIGLFNLPSYSNQPSVGETNSLGGIWDTGSGSLAIGGGSTLT